MASSPSNGQPGANDDHPPRASRGAATVLVVDDDEDIRTALSMVLSDEGYRVVTATDGLEAFAELERVEHLCLILLDLIMPRMDGVAFLERLRADPRFGRTPVAILSAGSILHAPEGFPFLLKPVALDRLLRVVQSHCPPCPTSNGAG